MKVIEVFIRKVMMKYSVAPTVLFCILVYVSVCPVNGETAGDLNFENVRPSSGSRVKASSEPPRHFRHLMDGFMRNRGHFDRTPNHRSHIDSGCKDCDETKKERNGKNKAGPNQNSPQPSKPSIRIIVSQGRPAQKEALGRRTLRPDVDSRASWRLTNKLHRKAQKLEAQRRRLAERLLQSENGGRNSRHNKKLDDQMVNLANVDPTAGQNQLVRKASAVTVAASPRSLILDAVRGHGNLSSKHSSHRHGHRPAMESGSSPRGKGYEEMPRDEAKKRKVVSDPFHLAADSFQHDGGNELVRPAVADRLESQGPSLLQSVHKLRRHTNAMMQAFAASELELDYYYHVIFNGTRYIMPGGARDALEVIHDASEDIMQGMTEAYHVRAKEMLQYHMQRDARRGDVSLEDLQTPGEHERQAMAILKNMESRDIHTQLDKMRGKRDEILLFATSIQEMHSECVQANMRVKRVKKLVRNRRHFPPLMDLRDYLSGAILTMNTGFLNRPALRHLRRLKRRMDHLQTSLGGGNNLIEKSNAVLKNTTFHLRQNQALLREWLVKTRRAGQSRTDSRRPARYSSGVISPEAMRYLNLKLMASDIHSRYLMERVQTDFRELAESVQEAEAFLSGPGTGLAFAQITPIKESLQEFTPETYTLLGQIGNVTGTEVKLKPLKKCPSGQISEGSGNGDEDEAFWAETSECDEDEGDTLVISGDGEASDDMKENNNAVKGNNNAIKEDNNAVKEKKNDSGFFGNFAWWSPADSEEESDADFTFEEEPQPVVKLTELKAKQRLARRKDIKQWNKHVRAYTAETLRSSEQLHGKARVLNTSLEDLRKDWKNVQTEVADVERLVMNQRDLKKETNEKAILFLDIRNTINKLSVPTLRNLSLSVRIAKAVERRVQAAYMGDKPTQLLEGYLDDDYHYNYGIYDDDSYYYYDDDVVDEKTEPFTELQQKDAAGVDYNELYQTGRQVEDNINDMGRLRTLAVATCGRIGSQLGSIHKNLSALRHKVHQARDMLNTLQLAISKTGKGHIAVSMPPNKEKITNDMTAIRLCIKPASLDGPVILVKGNNSVSFSVTLATGIMSVAAYDADWTSLNQLTMDTSLQKDVWYTIQLQRIGHYLNVSVEQQDLEKESKSKEIQLKGLESLRSRPEMVYLGGAPTDINEVSGSWEGCIGDLTVDGRPLGILSDGTRPSPCDSHCLTRKETLSTIFNGDGFLHYSWPIREDITSFEFLITTNQTTASLVSFVNSATGFSLQVMLEAGHLKVQSQTLRERRVYLSSNKGLNDGNPHKIKIEYKGPSTHISIDEASADFRVDSGKPNIKKTSLQGLVIGAFLSHERQFIQDSYRPFIGCMRSFSVNSDILLFSEAEETYNVYRGYCSEAQENIWHSCHQWDKESLGLVLDEVPDSNVLSAWVSSNASGPFLRYVRGDDFTLDITLTLGGLEISVGDSKTSLSRPDEEEVDFFSVAVVDKPDEKNVEVFAWGQSMEHSYGYTWFYGGADPTTPHSLVIAGLAEGDEREDDDSGLQVFTGALSRFAIGNRFLDVSQFESSHKLQACQRPLKYVQPRAAKEAMDLPVPPPQITCS